MTLILTIQTRGSIWLVADRRLSAPGHQPIDNAIKVVRVYSNDGIAMIGYAGLGATARKNQPSEWVSNVLRGRKNIGLEEMLHVIAKAMKKEFPPHIGKIPDVQSRRHHFIISAFLNDQPRIYTIDMVYIDGAYHFRNVHHTIGGILTPLQITVPFCLAGSGAGALQNMYWKRHILRFIEAYHRKKVHGQTVAKELAKIAYESHRRTKDGSVGPDCLVMWTSSKRSLHKGEANYMFFSHGENTYNTSIPTIDNGMDMMALGKVGYDVVVPYHEAVLSSKEKGEEQPNFDNMLKKLKEAVSRLPSKPDEKLR